MNAFGTANVTPVALADSDTSAVSSNSGALIKSLEMRTLCVISARNAAALSAWIGATTSRSGWLNSAVNIAGRSRSQI